MLWNWYTIDACFLSTDWRVKSHGGFAGLCIGVILLVVLLEFLRFAARYYDGHLTRLHRLKAIVALAAASTAGKPSGESDNARNTLMAKGGSFVPPNAPFRLNIWQQLLRAILHALQFAVAYWIMLLAMYYNGYIIICIIIGAFIGAFIFQWDRIGGCDDVPSGGGGAEVTGCCG
jgi:solute carrier family 31 (copper transporter), member 1